MPSKVNIVYQPKYAQIADYLRSQILKGKYKPDDQLPAELELTRIFGVNRDTVRQAIAVLISEGKVKRIHGRGTFVTEPPLSQPIENRSLVLGIAMYDYKLKLDQDSSFFYDIICGVNDAGKSTNSRALVITFDDDSEEMRKNNFCQKLIEKERVDGLIITSSRIGKTELLKLKESHFPFVIAGYSFPDKSINYVSENIFSGACKLVEHLINLGHKRIAYVGPISPKPEEDEFKAYQSVLKKHKIKYREDFVKVCSYPTFNERMPEIIEEFLCLPDAPTAILGIDDMIAIRIIEVLKEKNIKVPEDISVAGYNDVPYARLISPPLTTVRVPRYDIGKLAGQMLLHLIRREKVEQDQINLEPELIIRESTRALFKTTVKNRVGVKNG